MEDSASKKRNRAVYIFAAIGGILFAILLLAVDIYTQHHGVTNGEQGWRLSFVFLEGAPLMIVVQALHLGDMVDKWSLGTMMMVEALFDGALFSLLLLPVGFFWQHIVRTPLPKQ